MTTRRELLAAIPATGAAFAIGSSVLLEESPALAQEAAAPLGTHFHPKGKAPSPYRGPQALLRQSSLRRRA